MIAHFETGGPDVIGPIITLLGFIGMVIVHTMHVRMLQKHNEFLRRWNDAIMECYRAESILNLSKLGYILRQQQRIHQLDPNATIEELPDNSDRINKALAQMQKIILENA